MSARSEKVNAGEPATAPTLRDVAVHAGVHPATAGRALSPDTQHMVRPATLERVLESARRLNYRANAVARSLRTQRTSTVGVVIPDITNPLFARIVRGVDDALRAAQFASLVSYTDGRDEEMVDRINVLRHRGVDGLIVATARRQDPALDALHAEHVPIVQVNRRSGNRAIASVTVDNHGGARAAVEHLAELGHERIAHVGSTQQHSTGRARMAGYKAAMKRAGLTVQPGMTPLARAVTIEEGARAAAELLREHPDVTAIFAGNDLLALGCYDALAAAGRRCPEDVSVIGFNDMPFADRLNPPLTTLHFDDYEMGNAAAQLLLHHLRSGAVPWNAGHLELATSLVVRGSTAPASRGAGRRRAA